MQRCSNCFCLTDRVFDCRSKLLNSFHLVLCTSCYLDFEVTCNIQTLDVQEVFK